MPANLEELLSKAQKVGDAAEVFWRRAAGTPVTYENNKLKEIQTNATFGVALRLIKDGRIGFSTTTKEGDWDTLVDNALSASTYGAPASFEFAPRATPNKVEIDDEKVASLPVEDLVDTGRQIIEAVTTYDPQVLTTVGLTRSVHESGVLTTSGFSGRYRRTEYEVFVLGHLVEGENMLDVYDGDGSTDLSVDVPRLYQKVIEDLRLGRVNIPIKTGRYPAILTPNAAGDLLRPFISCLDGKAVERGISPWRDKLGQALFSPAFTLHDDPTLARSPASAWFDDEGVPTRKTTLIDRGQLASFYLDLRTAKALGRESTGNGWRHGLESAPAPATSQLVLPPGQASLASMIKGIRDGILIDQLMGAWAGNLLAGEVNGNVVLGFKIENGRITGRIKDCMFSANAFEAMHSQLSGLSRETKRTFDGTLPWILLDGVNISAKG
ncbi:MAG TPA: TldD/PmbA family protein [Bacillota bacterium]|jgi:PmbA protein